MESNPSWGARLQKAEAFKALPKELALKFAEVYPSQYALKIVFAIDALLACSAAVSSVPFDVQELQRTGNAFLEACSWLHNFSEDDNLWRKKPKHHMFKHMIAEVAPKQGSPNLYWCWADESLGGKLSKAAARKGGKHNPELISQHLMTRVSALQWCKPWRPISAASVVNSQKKGLVWGEKEELQEPAKRQMEREF